MMHSQGDGATIYHGDCLEVMRSMPDNSVDLIATDPPYFKVKGEAWDWQWSTPAKFLSWMGELCHEWQRILRPNGSLYVFASPKMAHGVEGVVRQRFTVLNAVTWSKPNGRSSGSEKEGLRSFFPEYERIIFAEHVGADNMAKGEAGYEAKCDELRGFVFEPIRAYLAGERDRAGIDNASINAAWCEWKGVNSTSQTQKWFSNSCWNLPTPEAYQWLRELFGGGDYLRKDYDDLRKDYDDLRKDYDDLRRPFTVTADVPYTDVWTFKTVSSYPGKHPCEKPIDLMRHIVSASSRPGAVVLDCFCGSGSTLEASVTLGRQAIGIDMDRQWCDWSRQRITTTARPFPLLEASA